MKDRVERVSEWCYQGLWGILTRWFNVPEQPPTLPVSSGEKLNSFQASDGFLRYLKFQFWIMLVLIDVLIIGGWLLITIFNPILGLILAPLAFAIAIIPDIVAFLAIYLRFDTTWYLMSNRSIRIRRGIWVIHETTITYENIQNVTINQGPLQRHFGIANVMIETAGGGGSSAGQASSLSSHCGLIEGVKDATQIREMLMNRVGQSKTAGLGDDHQPTGEQWTPEHLAVLNEIRDLIATS